MHVLADEDIEDPVSDSVSAPALLPLSWLGAIVADKRSTVGPQKVDGVEWTSQSAQCPLLNAHWKLESKLHHGINYQQNPTVNM